MSNAHVDTSSKYVPATSGPTARSLPGAPPVLHLLADGHARTGPALARQLGVSQSTVRRQVAALRAAGLGIDATPAGYRLQPPVELLDVVSLRSALPAAATRQVGSLENHWKVDSTSDAIARREADLSDLSFVFAEWQEAGRGRRGRRWISPPATNLQVSCLKRFPGGYASLSGLPLAMGIAAVRALHDCGARGVALKWPNDLVHGDAKLGGILIELGGRGQGPCHAIIGVGINLRLPSAARAALARPCTDLATLEGGAPPSRNRLATALVARVVEALVAFEATGFASFSTAWTGCDALAGRRIRVECGQASFEGVAAGVDARGALQVRTVDGIRRVEGAEVTVRTA